jgi:hypothetical protein
MASPKALMASTTSFSFASDGRLAFWMASFALERAFATYISASDILPVLLLRFQRGVNGERVVKNGPKGVRGKRRWIV